MSPCRVVASIIAGNSSAAGVGLKGCSCIDFTLLLTSKIVKSLYSQVRRPWFAL